MVKQQGVLVTNLQNGCSVFEFQVTDTSNVMKKKRTRKQRESKQMRLRKEMLEQLEQHMLDYIVGFYSNTQQLQRQQGTPTTRLYIGINDLLN